VENISDWELEKKIISLSGQIRSKLDNKEAMKLEREQWELISELLRRYREKKTDNLS